MKLSLNIFLLLFLQFFSSCDNQQFKFAEPTVDILITRKINSNTGYIQYQVNKGYGASISEMYAEIYDITDTTSQVIRQSLQLRDTVLFIDSALIGNLISKHDYRVIIKILTKKNEFASNAQLLPLSIGYDDFFSGIVGCDIYTTDFEFKYMESNNGFNIKPLQKGQNLQVLIYYDGVFNENINYEFKLNDSILLQKEVTYNISVDYVSWVAKLPANLPTDIYSLNLFVNGKKLTANTKINLLPGIYSEINIPEMPITLYPSWSSTEFILNDKIYFIYRQDVASYDISGNTWVKKKTITLNEPNKGVSSTQATFTLNGSQYLFVIHYTQNSQLGGIDIKLLKYNETNDIWEYITKFPDTVENIIAFKSGDCVYVGYKNSDNRRFWEYNISDNKWTRKRDLPVEINGNFTSACDNGNSGYCLNSYRELWQYNASDDSWQKVSTLYVGPYTRFDSKLVFDNGFIYLLGGSTYTSYGLEEFQDLHRYNLSTQNWEYLYLCRFTYNATASKFFYKNKIILLPCSGYNKYCKAEVTF